MYDNTCRAAYDIGYVEALQYWGKKKTKQPCIGQKWRRRGVSVSSLLICSSIAYACTHTHTTHTLFLSHTQTFIKDNKKALIILDGFFFRKLVTTPEATQHPVGIWQRCWTVLAAAAAALRRPARWRRRCDPGAAGSALGHAWSEEFWFGWMWPSAAAAPRLQMTPARVETSGFGKRVGRKKKKGSLSLDSMQSVGLWRICNWPFPKRSTSWSRCFVDAEGFEGSRLGTLDPYWSILGRKEEAIRLTLPSGGG